MKRILLLIFILSIIFSVKCTAEGTSTEDFLSSQAENIGADELENSLPDFAKDFLNSEGISPENPEWVNSLTAENVFLHIWSFLKSGGKKPLVSAAGILSVILISAALSNTEIGGNVQIAVKYAVTLSAAGVVSLPIFSVIESAVNAMQGVTVFMTSFIPIFAAILISGGAVITSASMSSLMLFACEAVNFISNFAVVPLLSGFTAISVASSASPLLEKSKIADGIKKLAFWIMGTLTCVFVGILGIQTAVNASADSLTLKTAKFILGSAVPVAGTALAEALNTVTASVGILKSTVGVYGIVAICAIFLPLLAELLIWRLVLIFLSFVSDMFSLDSVSRLIRSADTVIAVITGLILLTSAMFIISLGVVLTVAK
ncbi:MAG: hypothetical protein IJP34_06275 [Clostridia bacterium]|nr:hypothetical protein [Clostridia bacterium]